MEELTLPELSTEQLEILCQKAEDTTRKYISSKITSKSIEQLHVIVEVEGSKPLNLFIEVNFALAAHITNVDAQKTYEQAVKMAFRAAENYLRTLK